MKNLSWLVKDLGMLLAVTQLCACASYLNGGDYAINKPDSEYLQRGAYHCRVQANQVQQMSGSLRSWPYNESYDDCMKQLGFRRVTSN